MDDPAVEEDYVPSSGSNSSCLSQAIATHGVFKCRWLGVNTVVVRNLPRDYDMLRALKLLFSFPIPSEALEFIYIPCMQGSERIRGFATMKFSEAASALQCREVLHGKLVKRHADNGPLVVEPTAFVPLNANGTMFCDQGDMKPLYMEDPAVQELIKSLRMPKADPEQRRMHFRAALGI
eukprot:TRINITY_DN26278_c0_g1_i1.p1 TRINITY_DN26278_c0_g1~~TRINITY_DN26278_c0_g1_i1.p1  ORF type:complete len:179 (+),score=33.12 TRINITY_DN26278_c0_g1_i1:115-651(+)